MPRFHITMHGLSFTHCYLGPFYLRASRPCLWPAEFRKCGQWVPAVPTFSSVRVKINGGRGLGLNPWETRDPLETLVRNAGGRISTPGLRICLITWKAAHSHFNTKQNVDVATRCPVSAVMFHYQCHSNLLSLSVFVSWVWPSSNSGYHFGREKFCTREWGVRQWKFSVNQDFTSGLHVTFYAFAHIKKSFSFCELRPPDHLPGLFPWTLLEDLRLPIPSHSHIPFSTNGKWERRFTKLNHLCLFFNMFGILLQGVRGVAIGGELGCRAKKIPGSLSLDTTSLILVVYPVPATGTQSPRIAYRQPTINNSLASKPTPKPSPALALP